MTDTELINHFLARTDLSESETAVKEKCATLQGQFEALRKAVEVKRQELSKQEQEYVRIAHYLEATLLLALDLEKNRTNKSKSEAVK